MDLGRQLGGVYKCGICKGGLIGQLGLLIVRNRRICVSNGVMQAGGLIAATCQLPLEKRDAFDDPLWMPSLARHAEIDLRHIGDAHEVVISAERCGEPIEACADHVVCILVIKLLQQRCRLALILRDVDLRYGVQDGVG